MDHIVDLAIELRDRLVRRGLLVHKAFLGTINYFCSSASQDVDFTVDPPDHKGFKEFRAMPGFLGKTFPGRLLGAKVEC